MSGYVGTSMYNYRRLNGLGFMVCAAAISFTVIYLEEQLQLVPCALCTLARLITLSLGVIFLLAFFHNPGSGGQRFYGLIGFLLTLTGISATLRHIWLKQQTLTSSTSCDLNTAQLFDTIPSTETLIAIFQGASECATSNWTLMGLTIPEQVLILYAVLLIITWKLLRRRRARDLFR